MPFNEQKKFALLMRRQRKLGQLKAIARVLYLMEIEKSKELKELTLIEENLEVIDQ